MDALATDSARATDAPRSKATGPSDHVDLTDASSLFVERVPIAFARRFGVLGLSSVNGVMPVATTAETPPDVLQKLIVLLGIPIRPISADSASLLRAINQAYGKRDSGVETVIADLATGNGVNLLDQRSGSNDLLDGSGSAPVTRLVNLFLLDAVKRRASDVHVQPYEDRLQVRLRIDGVLYDYAQPPHHLLDEIVSRVKVMGRMNIAEKRLPQDGRTTVKVGERTVDLRVSTLPTCHGERVVIRLLDKSARLYRLLELGMSDRDKNVFASLIKQTHGILLVTGPTGSGKSTTLYAALQELDATQLNILTLEDPIEYQLPGISQTQVSSKKGMTFASGLRTVLRQDPDVVMVGEIRDQDTARMAIQSSLTGHLVLSTLHTNDAAGAVARLLDLGIEPYLVAGSLLGVLAQRLVRKVCQHCCQSHEATSAERSVLGVADGHHSLVIHTAVGCSQCHNTGYLDRTGVYELLSVDDAIQELITGNGRSRGIRDAACHQGMTTMREDAARKVIDGSTTLEEMLRVTRSDELAT